jgi:hypothetical protein
MNEEEEKEGEACEKQAEAGDDRAGMRDLQAQDGDLAGDVRLGEPTNLRTMWGGGVARSYSDLRPTAWDADTIRDTLGVSEDRFRREYLCVADG